MMQKFNSDAVGLAFLDEQDPKTEYSPAREFIRRTQSVASPTPDCTESPFVATDRPVTASLFEEHQQPKTPLVRLPPRSLPMSNVQVLQRWEGIVTECDTISFSAELKDLSEPDYPLELVELPISEIHPDDRPLIQSGACFYWSIGIKTSDRGVITRVSEIRFQRLPVWTRRSIAAAKKEAEKAFGSFWLAEPCSAE